MSDNSFFWQEVIFANVYKISTKLNTCILKVKFVPGLHERNAGFQIRFILNFIDQIVYKQCKELHFDETTKITFYIPFRSNSIFMLFIKLPHIAETVRLPFKLTHAVYLKVS